MASGHIPSCGRRRKLPLKETAMISKKQLTTTVLAVIAIAALIGIAIALGDGGLITNGLGGGFVPRCH
jgi:hypothetical protein